MKVEDYRNVVVNILVMLLVITLLFFLYNLVNPFDFPGFWQRLLFFDIGIGVLTFIFYFEEIVSFFSRFKFKKPWERKVRYKFEYGRPRPKSYHLSVPGFNLRKITKIDSCESFFGKFNELFERDELKFLLIAGGVIVYVSFLIWVFPKVSFDEFMFFALLLYVPLSLKLNLDSRYPIVIGLILLIVCAMVLAQKFENYAERIAIYAYYCLVIGISLLFFNYLKTK